jgi:hypothetical protein
MRVGIVKSSYFGFGMALGLGIFWPLGQWCVLRGLARDNSRAIGRLARHRIILASEKRELASVMPIRIDVPDEDCAGLSLLPSGDEVELLIIRFKEN